jgi:hypothetical protein
MKGPQEQIREMIHQAGERGVKTSEILRTVYTT